MSESPFAPSEGSNRRELYFSEKLYNTLVGKVDEFYVDSIPSDDVKAMPPKYMYPIGGCILVILLGVFVGVFLPSYLESVNQQFLVPGSTSSKYCNQVSISNSGSFLATPSGYWIGSEKFEYSEAAYDFFVQNLNVDTTAYASLMTTVYEVIEIIGQRLKTQDLSINLLYWMAYTIVNSESSAQRFFFTGNPVIVFNRGVTVGSISNELADCDLPSNSQFDTANGILSMIYEYDQFVNNPTCNSTFSPELFAYNTLTNVNQLSLTLDIQSLITAFAVNYGIILTSDLQVITASRSEFEYKGKLYNASSYTNSNFPGMTPIYCVDFNATNHCFVSVGATNALPIYNHMGSDPDFPIPCNCSTLTASDLDSKYDECNLFQFITGVVVYNNFSVVPLISLSIKYQTAYLNRAAYYPSFTGSVWGKTSPYYESVLNTPESRQQDYEFCYIQGYGYCTLILFSSFDDYNGDWSVSDYYYSIPNGACRDTVTPALANWQQLIDTPYAPLTQSYSECRNSPITVLFNQAGVAVGNVSLLSPFGVLFVLFIIGIYQQLSGWAIPKTYSRAEKDSAIDALAVALLQARDEKKKQKKAPEELQTMITQLVDDLSVLAEKNDGTVYKQETVEKFEVNWAAVVKSPFSSSGSSSRSQSRADSRLKPSSSLIELRKLEASQKTEG